MRVMVVGGGGREHAIVRKLREDARVTALYCAPGNAGIALEATCLDTDLSPASLLALAQEHAVDLAVVGPEAPLVAGVVDAFAAAGLRAFGPTRQAAQLEGSKAFAKAFMARHGIPTAAFETFRDPLEALLYLREAAFPLVVKDSNLAAGKGVSVAPDEGAARTAVENILGAPEGGEIVIEGFLAGQELSLLLFTDGESYRLMLPAQDYKQAFEGDQGPMTGGMGAVAPARVLSPDDLARVEEGIVRPTLEGLRRDGIPYQGVLFIGLMLTDEGPKVLEYNCRLGDPEAQTVLPLLKTPLLDVLAAVVEGRLEDVSLTWEDAASACVVLAARGYPGPYERGVPIALPEALPSGVAVLHAGTALEAGRLVSAGGRVLNVTAVAQALPEALAAAYATAARIDFPGAHYRRDIGGRLR